jgi:hypothetical protein
VAGVDRPSGSTLYRRVASACTGACVHCATTQQVEDADDLQPLFSSASANHGASRAVARQLPRE